MSAERMEAFIENLRRRGGLFPATLEEKIQVTPAMSCTMLLMMSKTALNLLALTVPDVD